MNKLALENPEAIEIYAMFWRLVQISVQRHGSQPTGELLTVLTIVLLDRIGARPTVSELAELTGLPKSSVSRYVSSGMRLGFLEEAIDPADRRRRYLVPTREARRYQKWHQGQLQKFAGQARKVATDLGESRDPAAALKEMLQRMSRGDSFKGAPD